MGEGYWPCIKGWYHDLVGYDGHAGFPIRVFDGVSGIIAEDISWVAANIEGEGGEG